MQTISKRYKVLDCNCQVSSKKEIFTCNNCNNSFCSKHIYYYVDESNIAITKNSKGYCKDCYKQKYTR